MKKIICVMIFCAMLFILVGCQKTITDGEVYEKEFREAYNQVNFLPLVRTNGKSSTVTMIPYVVHYPDRYIIRIKAFQDEEWKTEDFYVAKEVYDNVKVGDMFSYDTERGDLQDEPYTKERKEGG